MKQSYRRGIEAAERARQECERGEAAVAMSIRGDCVNQWIAEGKCRWSWTSKGHYLVVGDEYFPAADYTDLDEQTFARIALAIEAGQGEHPVPEVPPTSPGPDGTVWNDNGILRLVGGGQDDG